MMRFKYWITIMSMAVLGFIIAKGYMGSVTEIVLFFTMMSLYLGFSFSINNCFDVEEDKLNKTKSTPISEGKITIRNGIIFSFLLAFSGIALSAFFGISTFIFYSVLTVLSLIYSARPIKLKSRFLLDLLSHGLFFGVLVFILPLIMFNAILSIQVYLIALSVFIASILLEMMNHTGDYMSDKKSKLKTTVCILGLEKSKKLVTFLMMIFPIIFFLILLSSQYFLPFLVATLLFYLFFGRKLTFISFGVYAWSSYGLLLLINLL